MDKKLKKINKGVLTISRVGKGGRGTIKCTISNALTDLWLL